MGKSTLIGKFLEVYSGTVGGFRTVRTDSVYPDRVSVHMVRPGDMPRQENLLFFCPAGREREVWDRFDRLGCAALAESDGCTLLLMDELGPGEAKAEKFQKAVLTALDGEVPILGVLQQAESDFLRKIAAHPKVDVVEVTEENRDALAKRMQHRGDQRNSYGAVVLQEGQVLLVQGYRGWSFPKGKIEPGESGEEAAIRETREETGIRIRIMPDFRRTVPSAKPGDTRTVTFFLAESCEGRKEPTPDEVEYAGWFPAERALEMIRHEDDRKVLEDALEYCRMHI